MPRYSKLSIDGVIGDIYDEAAVHTANFISTLGSALLDSTIKRVLLNYIYPVGSYLISSNPANPSTYLGGTWTAVTNKFIIGASSSYPVGTTGGTANAIIPAHNHHASGTAASAGAHTHTVSGKAAAAGNHHHTGDGWMYSVYKGNRSSESVGAIGGSGWEITQVDSSGTWTGHSQTADAGSHTHTVSGTAASAGSHTHNVSVTVNSVGESGVGKNMPPYIAAYIWKRVS